MNGAKVVVTNEVTIRGAGEWGIRGAKVALSRSHVLDNGAGLGNGPDGGGGVGGGKVVVTRSTIENNAAFGIDASVSARVKRSRVMGHAIADVRSLEKPALTDTTCLLSRRGSLLESWGVCFGD